MKIQILAHMHNINCKGKILNLAKPMVMGIINATPDSFYKGDLVNGIAEIVNLATSMLNAGATIIDIGGQSTKPNAEKISVDEEIKRVIPVIKAMHQKHADAIISIDTFYSQVALAAIDAGASMVNDVSCGQADAAMIPTVGCMQHIPYIGMHMRGDASTMQKLTNYEDVVAEIISYLQTKKTECNQAGIVDFIADPGFGFAKNIEQNFKLLKNLEQFKTLDCPILIGVSRKSSIYKTLGTTATEALNGSTVLNTLAINNGANIIRVHDVKEAVEVVKLMEIYKNVD